MQRDCWGANTQVDGTEETARSVGRAMPALAPVFASMGSAAGWLLAASDALRGGGALAGALCGGAAGAVLARVAGPRAGIARTTGAVLAVSLGGGGVASALTVGALVGPRSAPGAILYGVVRGALLLIPALLVLTAARRAAAARRRSVAWWSEVRRMWRGAAVSIAVSSLAPMLTDLHASAAVRHASLIVAALAALVTAATCIADGVALRRIRAVDEHADELVPADEHALDVAANARLDLGFGDTLLALLAKAPGAYRRGRDRAIALVVGSPTQARRALDEARVRGIGALGLVAAALAGHAYVASPATELTRWVQGCDDGDREACSAAAARLESLGARARAAKLRTIACNWGVQRDCAEIVARQDVSRAAYERSCEDGDSASCRALARTLLTRGDRDARARAENLLDQGCALGDRFACAEVEALGLR